MSVIAYQEQRLAMAVRESGSIRELLYFQGATRNRARLRELLDKADPNDAFTRTLTLAFEPGVSSPALDAVIAEQDGWCAYTVVKALLQADRISDVVALVETRAKAYPHDQAALNLAARYCVHRERWDMGAQLARRSLECNPDQEDMSLLETMAARRLSWSTPLYLEVLPRPLSLAFYVPVYNVERYLEGALNGLFSQSHPLTECLVINDGTEDNSMALARHFPVKVIEHPQNRGLAAARNTAFAEAHAGYVGAVDSDASPDVSFSRLLMMEFENGPARLAGAGGNLIEQYDSTTADRWRARHLAQRGENTARRVSPPLLYGANCIFHRETVLEAGGYNERYRTNYEDADLCGRLKAGGWLLVHQPQARAYHLRRDTPATVLQTHWNWKRWLYGNYDLFSSDAGYDKFLSLLLGEATRMMRDDIEAGELALLPLDFQMLIHNACCGINLGVERGTMQPGHARRLQLYLVACLTPLDTAFGGNLRKQVLEQVAPLLCPEGTGDASADIPSIYPAFFQQYGEFLSGISAELYAALLG